MKTQPILRLRNPRSSSRFVRAIERRLPALEGRAVNVHFLPSLTAGSRKLYSNRVYGQPVHAATYIRDRKIILDQELERRPRELARILTHELFHFAWVRLGNQCRASYEAIVRQEWQRRSRGELGWSAESRKNILFRPACSATRLRGNPRNHAGAPLAARRWREYLCESFCDTAAWLYSGVRRHGEFTLAERCRKKRAEWFHATFGAGRIPI